MPITLVRFRSGQARSRLLLHRKRRATAPAALPKPENLDGEMPRKSAAELEVECLRLLVDPHTRGIKRAEIIRMYPKGTVPNCTYGAVDPMPTRAGFAFAQTLIASAQRLADEYRPSPSAHNGRRGAGPFVRFRSLTPGWSA